MGLFERFPYTNFHELNSDWLIKTVNELKKIVETFVDAEALKYADPILWNITTQYEKATIVLNDAGDAFLSKVAVPAGVRLDNEDYWLEIFNFMDYVKSFNSNLTFNVVSNTDRASVAYTVDSWLLWNDILYKVVSPIAIDDTFIVKPEAGYNIERFTVEEFCRTWQTYMIQTIQQYKNDIDASELAYRQQLALDIANTTNSLQAQLDAAISGATVDSEVINARVGANGRTYSTLGDSIRDQIDEIINSLKGLRSATSVINVLSGCGVDSNGDITSLPSRDVYVFNITGLSSITINSGEVYSLYKKEPTGVGSYSDVATIRAAVSPGTPITIPDRYCYVAIRNYPNTTPSVEMPGSVQTAITILNQYHSNINMLGSGSSYTPGTIPADLLDLNNLGSGYRNNCIYRVASFTAGDGQLNYPTLPFNGTILNFAPSSTSQFGVQLAIAEGSVDIYIRYFINGSANTYAWERISHTPIRYVSSSAALYAALRDDIGGILNIGPGNYDLYPYFETDILSDNTSTAFLTKDIIINGSGARIYLEVPDDVAAAHNIACNEISIIDLRCNATINDLSFICKNTRYCVHYESLNYTEARFQNIEFNNCHFVYTKTAPDLNAYCLGIGASMGQRFRFINCDFSNDIKQAIYIHGRDYAIGSIEADSCRFVGSSGSFFLSQYTGLTTPIDVVIKNCIANAVTLGGQSGGTGQSQYRVFMINSTGVVNVAAGITQLYPAQIINTIS